MDSLYQKTDIEDRTILITGGTGSVGYEIVRQLVAEGVEKVVVFSRDETKHFLLRKRLSTEKLETVVGDVRDFRSVLHVFRQFDFDTVYHAAAMKHVSICELSPTETARTNILGTQNVVDAALDHDVPTFITISTDKSVYPTNVMGATKFIAEKITLNAEYTCVRFGNVANSRGSVIPVFMEDILNGRPITVSDPDVTRFLMRIEDAVRLVIEASKYCQGGEVFVLKMKAFRLGDLVEVLTEIMPNVKAPVKVEICGLTPGEKLHEDLLDETELNRIYEIDDMYVVVPFGRKNHRLIELPRYSSQDVELISKSELRKLAWEYLDMKTRGDVLW